MNEVNKITTVIILIIFAFLIGISIFYHNAPAPLDSFAKCIKDSGTKLYGAYWCPHCNNQKNMFGKSQKYLPYTECSLPERAGQTEACKTAEIESYPTWIFSDNSKEEGEIVIEKLAEKTGCQLPKERN